MCWSGEASTGLAIVGIAGTAYAIYKDLPKELWISLGYFTLMEVLQAYSYRVIDQCQDPGNQVATLLAYFHIAFQPFFYNAMAMHFIAQKTRAKIQIPVYIFCFASAIIYLIRIYPFEWGASCYEHVYGIYGLEHLGHFSIPFCGKSLCTISGSWHLAWQAPTHTHYLLDSFYLLACFLLPLLYGSWRLTLYLIIVGPTVALLTTTSSNEFIAVWCLYSLAIVGVIMIPALRKLLYVKNWYGR